MGVSETTHDRTIALIIILASALILFSPIASGFYEITDLLYHRVEYAAYVAIWLSLSGILYKSA